MEKLYQKIHIPNYDLIQEEIKNLTMEQALDCTISSSWILDTAQVLDKSPNFKTFTEQYIRKPLGMIKAYASPPLQGTGPHIDGNVIRWPFGLVLPIANTVDTLLNWYEEDPENFRVRQLLTETLPTEFVCNIPKVLVPRNISKLKLLDSLVITQPTFTRSDIMHDVTNNTDKTRLTVVIRWKLFDKLESIIDPQLIVD